MLGAQDVRERDLDVARMRRVTEGHFLPGEVGELLRRVRMSVGELEQPRERVVVDAAVTRLESRAHEGPELVDVDPSELDLLRAAPERLVAVVEDRPQHVAAAAEIDMAYLALRLEDRPHHVRQRVVDPHDLLELVEHEHDATVALGGDLGGQLEQPLDRRVDVRASSDRLERESDTAVLGIELDRRPDPQPAHDGPGPLEEPLHGREEVVDDRLGERCGQPHLRRRAHQVAVRDEDVVGEDVLRGAEHERGLAVASRREHDDVLPVAHVGGERGDLGPSGS